MANSARVLQGVAGCCRVLQGVAGCCRLINVSRSSVRFFFEGVAIYRGRAVARAVAPVCCCQYQTLRAQVCVTHKVRDIE